MHKYKILLIGLYAVLFVFPVVSNAENIDNHCSVGGIEVMEVIVDRERDEYLKIRLDNNVYTDDECIVFNNIDKFYGNKNNSYLFLVCNNLGSNGLYGRLLTYYKGNLISSTFDGRCTKWGYRVVGRFTIAEYLQRIDFPSFMGECAACGLGFPKLWEVNGCNDNGIIMKEYRSVKSIYEHNIGRKLIKEYAEELLLLIKGSVKKPGMCSNKVDSKLYQDIYEFCNMLGNDHNINIDKTINWLINTDEK